MTEFQRLLANGISGESVVHSVLRSDGFKIVDVSNIEEYQKIDVDALMTNGSKEWKLEIKTDSRISETNNICFEVGFDRNAGFRDWWFNKCEADVLCIYDDVKGIIYQLAWKRTKKYVSEYGKQIKFWNKFDKCFVYLVLISLKDAYKNNLIIKTYKI